MIDKLEYVSYEDKLLDNFGNVLFASLQTRPPNNEEIVQKINEIIDYINAEEIGNENDRTRIIRKDRKSK